MDSAYYHLTHCRAEINTREEFTTFDNIKPVDSQSKVVKGNKQTLAATLGINAGISGLQLTALGSIFGSKAKEPPSTEEIKVFNPSIRQRDRDGVCWWTFIIDDPYQQQQKLDMQELSTLPYVSCTFMGSSDDEPPPPAPNLFDVEIMSCWSSIPLKNNPQMKPPSPYSNLCQIMQLDLPSQLSRDSYYKAVAKATPSSAMAFDVKRPSPHKFTPHINFTSSEGVAM